MDLFALAKVATRPDEAGEPPPTKFYELRDNLRTLRIKGYLVTGAIAALLLSVLVILAHNP